MSKEIFMGDGSQFSPEVFQTPNTGTEGPGGGSSGGDDELRQRMAANEAKTAEAERLAREAVVVAERANEAREKSERELQESRKRTAKDKEESDREIAEAQRINRENATKIEGLEKTVETQTRTIKDFTEVLEDVHKKLAEAERARREAEARGERMAETRYIFHEGMSDEEALDTLEDQIRVEEIEPKQFDENVARQLLEGITIGLKSRPRLQAIMREMLGARYTYKNLGFAMREGEVDLYADTLTKMGDQEHKVILGLSGMDLTLDSLNNDTYWRKKDEQLNPAQKVALMRTIFADPREARGFTNKFGADYHNIFTEWQLIAIAKAEQYFLAGKKNLKPEDIDKVEKSFIGSEKLFVDSLLELPETDPKTMRAAARRLIDRVNRNITLSEVAYNLTGKSTELDGLVDKSGKPISLNKVKLKYDKDSIDLMDPGVYDPSTKQGQILEKVRKEKPYLIAMAWDRAWRQLYQDRWDDIDFKNSLGGRAPSLIKKRQHNPLRYMQSDEAKPGEEGTDRLKRATYVGVLPLITLSMRGSVKEQLSSWGGDFGFRLGASSRLKGGDKVRKMFNEEGPRFLYNPETISNFDQSLKDYKEAISYLPAEEQNEQMAYVIEHLAVFSMDDLKRVFHYENQSSFAVDNRLRVCRDKNLINKEQEDILKNNVIVRDRVLRKIPLVSGLIRWFKVAAGGLNHGGALWEMIKLFFKQAFSLK